MADSIGTVSILHGEAKAMYEGQVRILDIGDPVFQGEKITTGPESALEITLADETVLSQGEKSVMVLDTYVYDADSGTGEAVIDLLKGTFRSVTGKIVDANPEAYTLQSPLAQIGIRGTVTGHTIPGARHPDMPEDHMVIEFDGKPVVVNSSTLPGMPPQIIGASGLKAQIGIDGHAMLMAMTVADFSYFSGLSSESLQQHAPDYGTDPLQDMDDDSDSDSDDVPADEQADDVSAQAQDADGETADGEQVETGDQAEAGDVVTLSLGDGDQPGAAPLEQGGGDPIGDPVEDGKDDGGASVTPGDDPAPVEPPPADDDPDDDPDDEPVVTEWEDWFDLGRDADGRGLDFSTLPETGTVKYGEDGYNDTLVGGSGNNVLLGLDGDDELVGSSTGKNLLFGGAGNDKITLGNGDHNLVYGGSGNDTIIVLGGGKGSMIWGGSGDDRIEYHGMDNGNLWESDEIRDFHSYADGGAERDQLLFDGNVFNGHNVSAGAGSLTNHLDPMKFASVAEGEYNPETGEGVSQSPYSYFIYMQDGDGCWSLFYDDNGTLAGGNVKRIAEFDEDVHLQAEDLAIL